MNESSIHRPCIGRARQPRPFWKRLLPGAFACMATLLSLPAQSVTIPDVPLQSGTAYPAPNIMFILDDSGSMEYVAMPGDVTSMDNLGDNITDKSYVHNTIYYNPAIDYESWVKAGNTKADDTRYTTGMSLDAVYGHPSLLSDFDDISHDTHTYFVAKTGATDLDDPSQYDRYDIKRVDYDSIIGPRVIRTRLSDASTPLDESNLSSSDWLYRQVVVPAGVILRIETSGPNCQLFSGCSDLYVRRGANPTSSNYDEADIDGFFNRDSNDVVVIDDTIAGTYHIGLRAVGFFSSEFEDVRLVVSYATETVEFATPTGGSEAEELENFATWWSYHRTRMKVAKAGASEAFSQLGDNYRVGYDSIWNRDDSNDDDTSLGTTPAYPIPTGSANGGLFTGSNRTQWFGMLQGANGDDGTPLHGALQRAGEYFESDAPWDSGTGADISCRQNFAILTTDGYWNSDSGYTDIGDADTTSGEQIFPPSTIDDEGVEVPGEPYQYQPENPFQDGDRDEDGDADGLSDTLADVAMHYWKRDLRPLLDNNVPESDTDAVFTQQAFWQHMVTFGISIGLQGQLDPANDLEEIDSGGKFWPNPHPNDMNDEGPERIDDLWHAAVNGHGQFVAATNPGQFVQGLLDALTSVAERLGSASNVTANSTSFRTDTRVYQASYLSGRWSGELEAFDASLDGIASEPAWQASQGIPAVADRKILTWDGDSGATFPTAAQIATLDASTRTLSPATGTENAAYIAGDQSLESGSGTLRSRATVLGDIANSSPIYVDDNDTIFVGANDGMLHAFAADDRIPGTIAGGDEVFAYVPGGIDLANLATLSDPNYTHKYFVDGPITVSAQLQTPGKNYLVGALGRGGRGVFALDVTDPDNFDAGDVLWEFSSDSDMGQVLGEPLVVTLNDVDSTKAVIVSNGINSPDGSAVLFVFNLATGELIDEIDTTVAGDNGLSAPRGWDDDGNGTVDYIYAGDLKGNLWKFDFSGATATSWVVANSGAPMFTAVDDNGKAQPITTGLSLARHPVTGQRWVFFGTGSFLTTADLTSTDIQSMYGVIDGGITITGRTSTGDGDLVERNIIVTEIISVDIDDDGDGVTDRTIQQAVRGFEPSRETLESGKAGWYVDLDKPDTVYAERIVSGPRVLGTALIMASIIPPTENTCDPGGSGYINALDAFTGASLAEPFFDITGDGKVDQDDMLTLADGTKVPAGSIDVGVGMPTRPTIIDKLLVVGGSEGGLGSVVVNPQGIGARRISWREILGG